MGDTDLVARVLDGDMSAFELIIRRYNRRLYRAAYGVVGNAAEAEDALQEAYLRAFAKLDTFEGPNGFPSWLTRITVNEALGRLRQRAQVVSFADHADNSDADGEHGLGAVRSPHPGPERLAASAELRHLMEQAIAELPSEFRAVFLLREVEGLSVTETASSLSIREATVKTRLHRARRQLRRALGGRIELLMPSLHEFGGRRCDGMVRSVLDALRPRPPSA